MLGHWVWDPSSLLSASYCVHHSPMGTDSEPLCSYILSSNKRSRSHGNKLSIPLTSRTPVARPGVPSINFLVDLETALARAPFQETPLPLNLWRTGHTRLGAAIPPCLTTKSCLTNGRSKRLRKSTSGPFMSRGACYRYQVHEATKVCGSGCYLPAV